MSQVSKENETSVVERLGQFIGVAICPALSWVAIALSAAADIVPNGLGAMVPAAEQSCITYQL